MTTVQDQTESLPSENPDTRVLPGIFQVALIMLLVGVVWRIVDVMVLNLGDTWLNIMPSKIGPLLIMIGVLWKIYGKQEMRTTLGFVKSNFSTQFTIGILLGVSFYLCVDILGSLIYHSLVNPSYELVLTIYNPELLWYAFIFFFVNAVYEETLFRGLLQNTFKTRISVNRAILLSAVIFGIWHAVWPVVNGAPLSEFISMVLLSGILGAFFGVYYEKFSSGRTL
ncbi:MAG: CPBP family intramembrane glutamic endopeptidase, partial [Candidatus Thorarchaeota archaeon]